MLLRDHPLMMFRGSRSWPPDRLWRSGYDDTHPQGEVGILKSVLKNLSFLALSFLFAYAVELVFTFLYRIVKAFIDEKGPPKLICLVPKIIFLAFFSIRTSSRGVFDKC